MSEDVRKSIHRASLLLMASVLVSRIIGFFREWILAQTVGATGMTDVYYASFTIPDFINHLMAAGALSISFIPILAAFKAEGKEDIGKLVFRSISTWIGVVLLILGVLAFVFARHLSDWVAPGFSDEQSILLAKLLRIILPAQFFFYWGGLAISVQHTYGRFFLPAIAPIIYNLGIISCGLLMYRSHGIEGFSIGVTVGCLFSHGVVQWVGIRKLGFSAKPYFGWSPEIARAFKRYLWLSLPISLGFSLVVADEWISKYFASEMETRAVSWLSYARTEMRIPIAIIGQAAGIASFPYLSKLWSERDYDGYASTLFREIEKLWALGPLAVIILITHALPLTHFIYGGGKFTAQDLEQTASALQMFSIGVFFWILQIPLSRAFYAAQRTWLPSLLGTAISILFIPLYRLLAKEMGFKGLALAGSIGAAFYCVLLVFFLGLHLRKHCRTIELTQFVRFTSVWGVALLGFAAIALGMQSLSIYRQTRLSGLVDILAVSTVIGALALGLLRTVFRRWTGTPLY